MVGKAEHQKGGTDEIIRVCWYKGDVTVYSRNILSTCIMMEVRVDGALGKVTGQANRRRPFLFLFFPNAKLTVRIGCPKVVHHRSVFRIRLRGTISV